MAAIRRNSRSQIVVIAGRDPYYGATVKISHADLISAALIRAIDNSFAVRVPDWLPVCRRIICDLNGNAPLNRHSPYIELPVFTVGICNAVFSGRDAEVLSQRRCRVKAG